MKPPLRLLINGITFDEAVLTPLLLNIKYWQSRSCEITFLGTSVLEKRIKETKIIKGFDFIKIKGKKRLESRSSLIIEGLRRNFIAPFYIKRIKNNYDVIYSRSSVLDLVIFPYFLKIFDKKVKWATVFDNTVELKGPGNKLVRLLAWIFFVISLVLLKKADFIFVISQDLENFLVNKGFEKRKIVLTGNAVEADLIREAIPSKKYKIDALFIGRINEAKGIYDMLEVLELVKKKHSDFQLAFMGEGDITTEKGFRKEVKQRDLEKNIQFLGYKSGLEKFNIIKSSKAFLFLSKTESFGIALLEAVCCGLKAFVYDLKPYQVIYKNNEVDIFEIGDYQGVANAIIETFNKKDFKNAKGKLLLKKYNWDEIAEIQLKSFLK